MATASQTIPGHGHVPSIREVNPRKPVGRNVSIDAYRGLGDALMMARCFKLSQVAAGVACESFLGIRAFIRLMGVVRCSLHDTNSGRVFVPFGCALPLLDCRALSRGCALQGIILAPRLWRFPGVGLFWVYFSLDRTIQTSFHV